MAEVSYRYYSRYLKLKVELTTLEQEIRILKLKQDKMAYSGCHDIKGIDYSVEKVSYSGNLDINNYYQQFLKITNDIRTLETRFNETLSAIKIMESTFKQYSKEMQRH